MKKAFRYTFIQFLYNIDKRGLTLSLLLFAQLLTFGQNHYWIMLNDKSGVEFDPCEYFDGRAIEKRQKLGIPLDQYTDLPVNENYIGQIRKYADTILAVSRWMNGIVILASEERLREIEKLDFVKTIIAISKNNHQVTSYTDFDTVISKIDSAILELQTRRMQSDVFWDNGFTGKGVRIAIFDVGFKMVDKHPAFEHIRNEGSIIKTYDFIKNNEDVYGYNMHGTMVLSCIAGKYGHTKIGLATDAEFLLARTERFISEFRSEEYCWLLAAEWADKNGADIINSSLGYTFHRYFPEEMTGSFTIVSKAAGIAASKGMLVVNAAGNEGADGWRIIGAPADNDSVLSVGGTDPMTDVRINFSSFGPKPNGKLKPNVCAFGMTLVASKSGFGLAQGTSFSSPLVAGFAACALQSNPGLSAMELFRLIEKSGHLYPYFDLAHGYGIPQAGKFLKPDSNNVAPTFIFEKSDGFINVKIDSSFVYKEVDSLKSKFPVRNLYYHIRNKQGLIRKYGVLLAEEEEVIYFKMDEMYRDDKIMVHFEGYTEQYLITEDE